MKLSHQNHQSDPAPFLLNLLKRNWHFDYELRYGMWPRKSNDYAVFLNAIELNTSVDDSLTFGGREYRYRSTVELHLLFQKEFSASIDLEKWLEETLNKERLQHTPIEHIRSSWASKHDTMHHLLSRITYFP